MTPAPAVIDETQNQPTPDQEFGPRNHDLPRCLKEAILEAIRRAQTEEKWMRRKEVLRDAKHRLYYMGIQHFYLKGDQWYPAVAGTSYAVQGGGGRQEQFGEYIDDYNIFTEYLNIQQAKLTESEPGIDFEPCDPKQSNDIEASNAAEAMATDFDRNNNVKELRQSFIYHMQMGGRVVTWTRTDEGTYAPSRRGTPTRSARCTAYGCLESKIPLMANDAKQRWYTILYEDIYVRNAKTDYPWVKGIVAGPCLAEGEYERIARLSVLRSAMGSDSQIQIADSANLVTEGNCWLRLSAFEECEVAYTDEDGQTEEITDEETGEATTKTVKEKLAELYPDGMHAVVIGPDYCESWNESADSRVGYQKAYIGKGQSAMPISAPLVVIQDRFNNGCNKVAEYEDFGDGSTWFGGSKPEFDAIAKQASQPGAVRHLGELATGEKAEDSFFQEKSLEVPKSVIESNEFLFGALPQFILAVPPAVWGQQMPDQQTKGGYELASAQATGILGVFWMKMTWLMAEVRMHTCLAVMDDADYPEEITVTIKGKNTLVRKESLTKGNFRAFPDTDSGFPESTAAQRQSMERLSQQIAQTPLAMEFYSDPDNIATIVRLYGMPELTLVQAVARDKQLREIEQLLSESPTLSPELTEMVNSGVGPDDKPVTIPSILKAIQQATDAMQQAYQTAKATAMVAAQVAGQPVPGQPPEPPQPPQMPPPPDSSQIAQSSVEVAPYDFHPFESRKCKDWLASNDCNVELTVGRVPPGAETPDPKPNILGVLNVALHMMEHDAWALKQAPPPMGPLPMPTAPPPAAVPGQAPPVGM